MCVCVCVDMSVIFVMGSRATTAACLTFSECALRLCIFPAAVSAHHVPQGFLPPPAPQHVPVFMRLTNWQVHYIANSGTTWGEHEIDYVFLIQADVDLDPNPNEVQQ